jgi:hypothetical protein
MKCGSCFSYHYMYTQAAASLAISGHKLVPDFIIGEVQQYVCSCHTQVSVVCIPSFEYELQVLRLSSHDVTCIIL